MTRHDASRDVGPDVDLDVEEIRLPNGSRLTTLTAEELAGWALGRHPGRPSISGSRERTPNLTVRIPRRTRAALEQIAAAGGRRLADVSREAIDEYVRRHAD